MTSVTNSGEVDEVSGGAMPLTKCPKCFGDAYMTNVEFICSDCYGVFEIDARTIENANSIYCVDPASMKERVDISDVDDQKSMDLVLRIQGDVLAHMQHLRKKYK